MYTFIYIYIYIHKKERKDKEGIKTEKLYLLPLTEIQQRLYSRGILEKSEILSQTAKNVFDVCH